LFSTNIKRSAATLGVVAGLLAAAGPASAGGVSTGDERTSAVKGISSKVEPVELRGTQVGSEGVKAPAKTWTDGNNNSFDGNLRGEAIDIIP
jgi:hypothetical protein